MDKRKKIKRIKRITILSLILALLFSLMITNNSNISYAADTATLNISINVDDERFDILDETMCNLFIYLTDSENNPIEGDYSYTGDESGTVTFTEGRGELILHGSSSSVKFENLPEGATYKVELKKYGCWYNEKSSTGKEGILGVEEKTTSITCTVNTMEQYVIAIIDMVDKVPCVFDNNFDYYLGTGGTCVPQPKEGTMYYTGANEVRKLEINKSQNGGLSVYSKVVLEDNGIAVLHNVPYNRNPDNFHRRDSTVKNEYYGNSGSESYIMIGECDESVQQPLVPHKLNWAGTSGYSGQYIVMRISESSKYLSALAKLYARQDANGEIITEEPDFDGGEDNKEHTFRIKALYHSALGEDHDFYLTNFVLPTSITTIGSSEDPVEGTIKLDENGEAYIKLKANQICVFGDVNTDYVPSMLPYDANTKGDFLRFDDNGDIVLDERLHVVNDQLLGVPHSGYKYYADIEVEEVCDDDNYSTIKYFGDENYEIMNNPNNYIANYLMAHSQDCMMLFWWLPYSTMVINMRNFTGELNVSKEFEGEYDPNREFTFNIKFKDDASDLKDFYMNNIYLDYGDKKVHLELNENYEGTFKLKVGEKVNIISDCENLQGGLPVGARYEISEVPGEDYKTEAKNAVGKVKDGVITITFNNSSATVKDPIGTPKEEKQSSAPKTGDVISISISVLILSIAILCRLIKIKK